MCAFAEGIDELLPLQGHWQVKWNKASFATCNDFEDENDACLGVTGDQIQEIREHAESRDDVIRVLQWGWSNATRGNMTATMATSNNASTRTYSLSGTYGLDGLPNTCGEGHTGNLCQECAEGFTRSGDSNCAKCIDFRLQALIFALGLTLGIMVICFMIRRTINSKGSLAGVPQIMMLKIMVTHCQIVAMAQSFPLQVANARTPVLPPGALHLTFAMRCLLAGSGPKRCTTCSKCWTTQALRAPRPST